MLHALPITNVRLSPCHVAAGQLTPVAGGHFCSDCQRLVHDFTQATAAELAAARAASPDGRLCGRFRLSQLAPDSRPVPPRLRPRLRQFLLAAVLILVQGFSARQAWAQVQPRVPFRAVAPLYQMPGSMPMPAEAKSKDAPSPAAQREQVFTGAVELMPQPPGGTEGLIKFLQREMHYPAEAARNGIEGKVFVRFTVTHTGQITGAHIVKGVAPALDAEALRVVGLLPPWTPGTQNNQPVDVQYTMPLSFTLGDTKPAKKPDSTE